MDLVTITHPLALEETPDEPLPRRVTDERDGTRWRVLVGEDGTLDVSPGTVRALADEYDVPIPEVTDEYDHIICAAETTDGTLCEHPAGACPVAEHGEG